MPVTVNISTVARGGISDKRKAISKTFRGGYSDEPEAIAAEIRRVLCNEVIPAFDRMTNRRLSHQVAALAASVPRVGDNPP